MTARPLGQERVQSGGIPPGTSADLADALSGPPSSVVLYLSGVQDGAGILELKFADDKFASLKVAPGNVRLLIALRAARLADQERHFPEQLKGFRSVEQLVEDLSGPRILPTEPETLRHRVSRLHKKINAELAKLGRSFELIERADLMGMRLSVPELSVIRITAPQDRH